ncbi:MAG: TPM domain-containing protein [Bergeyella sp.]|nr:TPM domain-containing protein [Bergeyella sp.]
MKLFSLRLIIALSLWCGIQKNFAQYTIPNKPDILYPVYDEVGLLSPGEKNSLNEKLIEFEKESSTEILVIIIPTTKGEDINFIATLFGEKWGLGKKGKDNGIVFLIAKDDRNMAIQQGRSIEQYITASVAGQILDYIVTPNFKQGKWYEGIDRGTSAIMEAIQGKFKPDEKKGEEPDLLTIIIITFIILIILSLLSKDKDKNGNYENEEDVVLSRRGYSRGDFPFPVGGGFGGGSRGKGGGFGGLGGGGSFGGGGASGNW